MAQQKSAPSASQDKQEAQSEAEAAAAAAREGGDRKSDKPEEVHDLFLNDLSPERLDQQNANLHYGTLGAGEEIRDAASVDPLTEFDADEFAANAPRDPARRAELNPAQPEEAPAKRGASEIPNAEAADFAFRANPADESAAFAFSARGAAQRQDDQLQPVAAPGDAAARAGVAALPFAELNNAPTATPIELAAGREGVSRHWVAISRLATPSSPVTAGVSPLRTALRKAISSARSGSSWPTGRCRIE